MAGVDTLDRRRDPRLEIQLPLKLRVPTVEAAISGATVNISKSGMFIAMAEPLVLGARLDVEVALEHGELLLHCTAEVVRQHLTSTPPGVGVRFLDISYEAQTFIDRMVQDQSWFGDYRLETLLGRGGMAEVYRAWAVAGKWEGRRVALKRIRPELAQDELFARLFRQEASTTLALHHPNIVEVLDVGRKADTCFIVLEYVDGIDLRRLLGECRRRNIFLPIDFACYVAKTIATALDYAHRAVGDDGRPLGLVHRDVNPANVFVSNLGEIKLGDFGVAHLATRPEQTPMVAGKAPYVAPEMLRGEPITPAADVFALGAVLYELLTNRVAFEAPTTEATHTKVLDGDVPPPARVRPEISAALDAVVMQALSPRLAGPAAGSKRSIIQRLLGDGRVPRFADAASLAQALDGLHDPAIGNQLAIAAVVRGLLATRPGA